MLATKLEGLGDQPAVGMFTIGNVKVIPNVSGTFHRGTPVGVYMQIYNAGIDQTTLRPSVDVEYALMKDGKEIGKQGEDWRGTSDAGQRLTLARLINSANLAPGEYAVEVRVKDRVSGQSLIQTAKVHAWCNRHQDLVSVSSFGFRVPSSLAYTRNPETRNSKLFLLVSPDLVRLTHSERKSHGQPKFDPDCGSDGTSCVRSSGFITKCQACKTLRTSSERLSLSQTGLLLTGCETWADPDSC